MADGQEAGLWLPGHQRLCGGVTTGRHTLPCSRVIFRWESRELQGRGLWSSESWGCGCRSLGLPVSCRVTCSVLVLPGPGLRRPAVGHRAPLPSQGSEPTQAALLQNLRVPGRCLEGPGSRPHRQASGPWLRDCQPGPALHGAQPHTSRQHLGPQPHLQPILALTEPAVGSRGAAPVLHRLKLPCEGDAAAPEHGRHVCTLHFLLYLTGPPESVLGVRPASAPETVDAPLQGTWRRTTPARQLLCLAPRASGAEPRGSCPAYQPLGRNMGIKQASPLGTLVLEVLPWPMPSGGQQYGPTQGSHSKKRGGVTCWPPQWGPGDA